MESEKQTTERETPPQHWISCKLIIDPALTKGLYKVCRYDGQFFNIPVEDLGLLPVDTVRDPRICRLWSKSKHTELQLPKYKVDEWYVGPVPPKEVTFSRLNDNVKETFLTNMCNKYGNVEEVEIFYNPRNKKHLGVAKVVFDTVRAAKDAVRHLHQTSVMGNIIHVEIDLKGENRDRYLQLLLSGVCTPWTLPSGNSEPAVQSLIDNLLVSAVSQGQGVSSPISIATPLSLDTAYSSIWQDTPCSFGLTPQSQGTPRTPCLTATPLSQDSCYSSLQATPVLQGEPSTYSVPKPLRQELCHRKPARHHRGSCQVSSFILKHCHSQPPLPLFTQKQTSGKQLVEWSHNAQSTHDDKEPSFNSFQESVDANNPTSTLNSFRLLSTNFTADRQTIATSPPDDNRPGVESLDSRIQSLLINSQINDPSYFDRKTLEADTNSQDSPASPCSALNGPFSDNALACTPTSRGSSSNIRQWLFNDVVDDGRGSLIEHEDETAQAVSFLTRSSQSPSPHESTHLERRDQINNDQEAERFHCPKELHAANEESKQPNTRESGNLTPTKETNFLELPPDAPPAVAVGHSHPPFPFPIPPFPPSIPPVPPRLPNGTIPIPPPGWMPPPGHRTGIPIPPLRLPPPPSVPPPPTFLGPPPHLILPPSVPPPVHLYPLPMQPASTLDKGDPPRHGSAPLSLPLPPWPAPHFPRFNPFVPPPGYPPVQENPHKITAEKVLEVLMDELKSVIKKDITRRMIEGVAFKAFEDWWDCQEKKTKVEVSPVKSGAVNALNPISHINLQGKKPPLPSFKVKRKRPEIEDESCSAHEHSDVKQKRVDTMRPDGDGAKRRHARPLELDSEDEDDGKEEDNTIQAEDTIPGKVEVPIEDESKILSDRDDYDSGDDSDRPGEEDDSEKKQQEDEDSVVFKTADGMQCLDSESFSESSSSEESEYSSDLESSDSFSSESFEDSSSDLGSEDEEMQDGEDSRSEECVVISSDEDSMELEAPLTPSSAPLTPGAQLDQDLQDWSDLFQREEREENHYVSRQQDSMMELGTSKPEYLQPPSPIGLPVEADLDVEMESCEWTVEPLENIENLRPLTPTGFLVDSDPDIVIKSKATSPAVEEVERPQTPGKGIVVDLESEDSGEADEVLSLSPSSSELILSPPDLLVASYPSYQEMPKTPGREERAAPYSSVRAPATPGRGTVSESSVVFPPLTSPPPVLPAPINPYITAPKTPGRDIILPRRAIVYKRKTQMIAKQLPLRVSPSHSLSDSSSDTADEDGTWICSGVRARPLQGLENMPGLLDEEKSSQRHKRWRRLKRRRRDRHLHRSFKRVAGSLSSNGRPHRWRSLCEERRILHRVWRDGLDEEDARLLQITYERLQEQDNGIGWLSDTVWIDHPLTKVLVQKSEEHKSWQPIHRTGSARSEGFYKISKKDKMKYLNNVKASESPSTSAQGMCIPVQHQTSLRSGSEFRSEQRRLLSSFSCDSDLVKFNQLKFRKKRICFSRSHIHEWGLFAMEPIAADEMVIEYVGEIIRQIIADMREQRYEEEGIGSSYLFRVDQDTIIDATKCGNLARFINHSCNPNCYAKIITVESQKKIVIYSRQPISINEEITYDYKFPIEETKIPCLCGADSCRGSLN
ncbi:histone-lysine N-methyltransferase SETD1B-A-like [Mugil cephalus]|uniref:histone-lysine N-methyltransferase SETD1B-A-like n=1 Tax=Mugil cephalus TaxID=48193 RepID=UPI001FB7A4DF|nr:histone-lysine N-methyltransferase SETD1B-A-like [Mugil cephalus]